jgi:ferredoxin
MPVIEFVKEGKRYDVPPGTNLRKFALKCQIPVYKGISRLLNCRGHRLCGTCRVELIDGKGIPARTPAEEDTLIGKLLIAKNLTANLRLSCQVMVNSDVKVMTRPTVALDKELTKQRTILLGIFLGFGLVFLSLFGMIFFDLLKKF